MGVVCDEKSLNTVHTKLLEVEEVTKIFSHVGIKY